MARLIQDDLKQIGMQVTVVPLEFRSLLDRVQRTRAYEACILSLASRRCRSESRYGGVAEQRRRTTFGIPGRRRRRRRGRRRSTA